MRTTDEKDFEWQPTSRSARWYEWLLILLLLGLAGGVRAESVYKCINAHSDVAYQAQPCADGQLAHVIEIPPAPPVMPSPKYAVDDEAGAHASRTATRARSGERRETSQPVSYECRATDGQVFYRHASCPHSIPAGNVRSGGTPARGRGANRGSSTTVSVSAQRISREDACREIHRAGAAGRDGHEHDEIVSSYEHNLGRDPCR
jgi:hypothetical protein